jgi:putative ABC transport system permease protein
MQRSTRFKFLVALTGSLVVFLGVTGIIALIVAGFVLANLFLLSVKERTKEIGIRRATGAKKRDILIQFLGESVAITTLGGLLGFLIAWGSSKLLIYCIPIPFSWKAFAGCSCVAVGNSVSNGQQGCQPETDRSDGMKGSLSILRSPSVHY